MPVDLTARRCTLALAVAALVALLPLSVLAAAPAQAESASSAKTVSASEYDADAANSPFPDLKVTVSQTQDLIEQGIGVSWTGGVRSSVPSQQTGGQNFLQLAQCWGDEPGSNGTRPDRTTCLYGAFNTAGAARSSARASTDSLPTEDSDYTAPGAGWWEPTVTSIPFKSATGVTLATIAGGKRVPAAPNLSSNEFYTKYTTNEVSWAGSGADGSGSVSFELQTVQQSPALGCGTPVTTGGETTGTPCWLVVIPRGTQDGSGVSIRESGLFWETWKHHVAIRLGFKPAGLSCSMGAAERQLSGSELVSSAIGQWQPKLCNNAGGAVYSLITGPESDAALAANGTAAAPMALTSRALSAEVVTDHLKYAPVALTGVSIAFAFDHQARVTGDPVPEVVQAKERQPFTSLKLTPRLLAKLLTSSYTDALPSGADWSHLSGVRCITKDPEFLAINDKEWSYMHLVGVGVGDALTPLGRSDAALTIWTYIMADADAKSFLAGKADPWGMKVNPYYSTSAAVNPTGTGLTLPRDDFPGAADPIEYKGTESSNYADSINLVAWRPFTSSLDRGAYNVLRGDALTLGLWDPLAVPPKYSKGDRALIGLQALFGVTDTSAAAKYQVLQASLLNPAGNYVTPSSSSLSAAAAAMVKDVRQPQVVGYDPTSRAAKDASSAYPLAMPVYAAVNPAMTGDTLRSDYAAFITYAARDGQVAGNDDGELPLGYAPLPAAWSKQAISAAAVIKAGGVAAPTPTPTPTSSSGAGSPTAQGTVGTSTTGGKTSDPEPSGDPVGSLTGATTAADPSVGVFGGAVPAGVGVALAAALGAPMMSRFRRRQP